MKSIQLLSCRKWLLALALREKLDAVRLARASSGFGGIVYSCDYYVERITETKSRERHYRALARLGVAALQRLDREPRTILERRYLKKQSCEDVATAMGIRMRSFYRKKEEAVAAFDAEVRRILAVRNRPGASKAAAPDRRRADVRK